jgi:cation transport regulator ChaC
MTEPTPQDIVKFKRAASVLAALGKRGIHLYLANDVLHLMKGPTHDENFRPLQNNVVQSVTIPNAGGGDW